jgi:3-methylcrotonyl-CoA carboxylase alpha subunit
LYAEDPYTVGIPSTGPIGYQHWPDAPGRRFDYGYEAGDEVTSFYDSMMAKIIVWDESRPRAIQKMLRTLDETILFGVKSNIPFLKQILQHPEFIDGSFNTQFINQHFPQGATPHRDAEWVERMGEVVFNSLADPGTQGSSGWPTPFQQPWRNS